MPEEKPVLDHEPLTTKLGGEFIAKFYRLYKGTTLYDRENAAIDGLARDCLEALNGVIQSQGALSLKIVRDDFFFNNLRIRAGADQYLLFKNFRQEMRSRRLGEIKFSRKSDGDRLKDLAYLLSGLEENNESNFYYIKKELEARNIESIEVGKLELFKGEDIAIGSGEQKKFSKEVYFGSIGLVKEIAESIHQQKSLNIRKAKRLMQNAMNAMAQDDSLLLGLANIKNYEDYLLNHSVNVAIYAMALGQRIGIPKRHLSHLGIAGLFHDIGKTRIAGEILDKLGKLSTEEGSVMRSHPVSGAELIMKIKEWGELSTRMVEGAFEHHLRYDLTGYPKLTHKIKMGLFGRIIAVADFYDALTRPRDNLQLPYLSEKILKIMLDRSGKDFDPAIVKVFINMIGVFPLGTLVLLNTNEMGIVTQGQDDAELSDRPKVCLIHYSDGEYRTGKVVDLKEADRETGGFKRSIVQTLDPNEYSINVAEFLI